MIDFICAIFIMHDRQLHNVRLVAWLVKVCCMSLGWKWQTRGATERRRFYGEPEPYELLEARGIGYASACRPMRSPGTDRSPADRTRWPPAERRQVIFASFGYQSPELDRPPARLRFQQRPGG
jgi:hypothetical protein